MSLKVNKAGHPGDRPGLSVGSLLCALQGPGVRPGRNNRAGAYGIPWRCGTAQPCMLLTHSWGTEHLGVLLTLPISSFFSLCLAPCPPPHPAAPASAPQLTRHWYQASASALLRLAMSSYCALISAMMPSTSSSRLLSIFTMTEVSEI